MPLTAAYLWFHGAWQVHVVASLPCYSEANVDTQRGRGVFERSILGLQRLNAAGYGMEGSGLQLDLVYNPGAPPARPALTRAMPRRPHREAHLRVADTLQAALSWRHRKQPCRRRTRSSCLRCATTCLLCGDMLWVGEDISAVTCQASMLPLLECNSAGTGS